MAVLCAFAVAPIGVLSPGCPAGYRSRRHSLAALLIAPSLTVYKLARCSAQTVARDPRQGGGMTAQRHLRTSFRRIVGAVGVSWLVALGSLAGDAQAAPAPVALGAGAHLCGPRRLDGYQHRPVDGQR